MLGKYVFSGDYGLGATGESTEGYHDVYNGFFKYINSGHMMGTAWLNNKFLGDSTLYLVYVGDPTLRT